jgi:hypothetical protein
MSSGDFEEQLNEALCTRPCIEQAKGVLAALRHCTAQQAFEEISYVSQQHNIKLFALANALVDTAAELAPEDQKARAVIWVEWGDLFPVPAPD